MLLVYTLLSTMAVSLLSLIGVVTLAFHRRFVKKIIWFLVALAAGTMMGAVFLHLLPEAHEFLEPESLYLAVLGSFILFFLIEKVLHWQHCHQDDCEVHSFGYMSLIGDGLHNFIDGLVIAGAYLTSIELGLVTTVAVIFHEFPQELSDFGVLLHAGFTAKKALLFNFLSALMAIIGALFGFYVINGNHELSMYLLPVAAGGFLYISASDLLPEIRKEKNSGRLLASMLFFLLGIGLMAVL